MKIIVITSFILSISFALNNGVGRTPAMGYDFFLEISTKKKKKKMLFENKMLLIYKVFKLQLYDA